MIRATTEIPHITLDFFGRREPTRRRQSLIFFHQNTGDDPSGMVPFVEDLVQNACIRMLHRKAASEQLEAHPGDLFDQNGNIHKPPTTKYMEVAELPSENAKFVLVLAGQDRAEKLITRMRGAQVLQGGQ